MAVSLKENNWFFVMDQTPCPNESFFQELEPSFVGRNRLTDYHWIPANRIYRFAQHVYHHQIYDKVFILAPLCWRQQTIELQHLSLTRILSYVRSLALTYNLDLETLIFLFPYCDINTYSDKL
jgi:hypothetical protein